MTEEQTSALLTGVGRGLDLFEEVKRLRAECEGLRNAIETHNARMHNCLTGDKPDGPANALRFLAAWMDSIYGDAGTGRDTCQQDLRVFAAEVDAKDAEIARLQNEMDKLRAWAAAECQDSGTL